MVSGDVRVVSGEVVDEGVVSGVSIVTVDSVRVKVVVSVVVIAVVPSVVIFLLGWQGPVVIVGRMTV